MRGPTAADVDLLRELGEAERRFFSGLTTPAKIQAFLDTLAYSAEPIYRCPLRVLRERTAHCFDAALFAAAALRQAGHPPLILELLPNAHDDDHLLALFRRNGCWGAVAKSNFAGLRYREPVYRTLRELALSFFEQYYNIARRKTLRGYTMPLHLAAFDRQGWTVRDHPLWDIADRLDTMRRVTLVDRRMAAGLSPVDERLYQAGLIGSVAAGLYRPEKRRANPPRSRVDTGGTIPTIRDTSQGPNRTPAQRTRERP